MNERAPESGNPTKTAQTWLTIAENKEFAKLAESRNTSARDLMRKLLLEAIAGGRERAADGFGPWRDALEYVLAEGTDADRDYVLRAVRSAVQEIKDRPVIKPISEIKSKQRSG